MEVLQGRGVSQAIAIGRLSYCHFEKMKVPLRLVEDPPQEVERFYRAKDQAAQELRQLYHQALRELGRENAMIFETHRAMLEDQSWNRRITDDILSQRFSAEYAVSLTAGYYGEMFRSLPDPYLQQRAVDIRDVARRLQRILLDVPTRMFTSDTPVILAAKDLDPSETVRLDRGSILALVTRQGSDYSHTAILARDMGIPAIVGLEELNASHDGRMAVVDGVEGLLYLDPDPATLQRLQEKRRRLLQSKSLLQLMKGKDNVTQDGHRIDVYANIADPADVQSALDQDAGGIGLMRSEFLYLNSQGYPTEEEQYQAYCQVVQSMEGRTVIIRTLDIGADKQADYFELTREENPAMGFRAIRICLEREELFGTQLRAILRASAHGRVAVMFPMITAVGELRQIREILCRVQQELRDRGVPFDPDIKLGAMIETPAAALISDLLAREVDFFSIGTNDLLQYSLAVDRQNPKLARYYDVHHPAVLRLIRMVVENAHRAGIKVGICGELAADLELTEQFLRIGVDELSVAPSSILPLRKRIRELDLRTPPAVPENAGIPGAAGAEERE